MSKLTAKVQFYVDGGVPVHEGTATIDTEDTGTPWMQLMADVVAVGTEAHRKADERIS